MGLSQWRRKLGVSPIKSWKKLSRYLSRPHRRIKPRKTKYPVAKSNNPSESTSVLAKTEKQETNGMYETCANRYPIRYVPYALRLTLEKIYKEKEEKEDEHAHHSIHIDCSGNLFFLRRAEMAWRRRRFQEAKEKQLQIEIKEINEHGERSTDRQMESGGWKDSR